MKNIQEMVRIVTRNKLLNKDIIDDSESLKGTKIYTFYKGVAEGKFQNDDEIAESLYGEVPKDSRFRKLKNVFKNKLISTILLIDFNSSNNSNYRKAYLSCLRYWYLTRLITSLGGRNTGVYLAKQSLKIAQTYKFYDIIYFCAKYLRLYYMLRGEEKYFDFYSKMAKKGFKVMQIEEKSEYYRESILINFVKSSSIKPELIPTVKDYVDELEKYCKFFESYILRLNTYRIKAIYFEMKLKYDEAIKVYSDAEKFISSKTPLKQDDLLAEFSLKCMVCYLYSRDYVNGKINAEKCFNLFRKGSVNWLVFLEYYFLLSMHSNDYQNAAEIYKTALSHPRFKQSPIARQEWWNIAEAYLNYIYEHKGMDIDELEVKKGKSFKLYKFLNEVPKFSKDKGGYNVAILIVQTLLLLERKEFGKIIDRAESLKVYRSRYLKGEEHHRSSNFVKMLLVMEQKGFNYKRTKKVAQKYYDQMQARQMKYEGNVSTLEVIPFEQLWENVLEKLKEYS